jgi:hypothetical protein
VLGLVLSGPVAFGEPFLAQREGYKCSVCHVNRTGGGMRTGFGSIYSQTRLPTTALDTRAEGDEAGTPLLRTGEAARFLRHGPFFDTRIGERVTIGGDFRTRLNRSFAPERRDDLSFDVREGRVYLHFELVEDFASFYVDETLGPGGAGSREIFALVEGLPLDGYVKAGKILPPYGIRLLDDASFIREATGFNYNNPDLGVELGLEPGPHSIAFAVTNGTAGGAEDNRAKQVSMVNSVVFEAFRAGASIAYNPSDTNRRFVYGAFGGVQIGRLGILGEVDLIRDQDRRSGDVRRQLASFLEFDFEVYRGVNLRSVFEFLDPDKAVAENARTRFSVGVQWFVLPSVELNAFLIANDSIPQEPEQRTDFLFVELHLFF